MKKTDYLKFRNKYLPRKFKRKLKTIFILESPPFSDKFFYNPNGKITEPLFSVYNKGRIIPFPSWGNQKRFYYEISRFL